MAADARWIQRYQNLARSIELLREPVDLGIDRLSDLEKQETIQRFEIAVELAWKTMKDYLESEGAVISPVTPKSVIKEAFAAGGISDGQEWVIILNYRSIMSRSHDSACASQGTLAFDRSRRARFSIKRLRRIRPQPAAENRLETAGVDKWEAEEGCAARDIA